MSDKLDELGTQVDDALITVDELQDDPGKIHDKKIEKVKDALEKAQDTVDDMENSDD